MNPPFTARLGSASVLGICLLAVTCDARPRNNPKVDQLFAQWDHKDSPGAAVVIVKDGSVVYEHGYGYANLEHRIPITPQTRFDVASVAKQFTGLSVAMLMEQGRLSLADDIRKFLPDVPDFGKPITLANLLHHTSGLRDWPETLALSGLDMEGPISLDTILEMVRRQRELDFPPGEEHLYSNTGYNLLAATVAKVTGKSFRMWTDANLFQPLGMKDTLVCDDPDEVFVANRAESYAAAGGGRFRRVVSQLSAQGSSSLFITAEDMGRWLLNFESARVGGKAAMAMMQQPGILNSGAKVDYGFGVGVGSYRSLPAILHGGSWAGYRSFTMVVPEKRFAVAVLANVANLDAGGMGSKIADLYLALSANEKSSKAPAKPRETVRADPASWDAFQGTYRLGPGWLLTITREGNQLMAQATHEDKFKMTPRSDRKFFVDAYQQPVEFVRQESGAVTNLLYRGINAPRLRLPELTPARLGDYAGDYWSDELQVVTRMEVHDGKLATRLRTGNWIDLLPTGADCFDTDGAAFAVEFTRGPASGITEVSVSGGRVRHLRYTRVTLSQTKLLDGNSQSSAQGADR